MKTITLSNGQTIKAMEVYGGKELYQGSRREYLEIVVPQEGHTVEGLEAEFDETNCSVLTISEMVEAPAGAVEESESEETEADSNASTAQIVRKYIHEGYVIRGTARVFLSEDTGAWYIGIKRYQRTHLEQTVAQLQAAVAALQGE